MSQISINKLNIFIITLFIASVCSQKFNSGLTGVCLKASLQVLVDKGCNFEADPEVVKTLLQYGSSTENFNIGQATYEQSTILFPTPKYISGYFKTAIANKDAAVGGEMGAGIQYYSDFMVIGMDNIHLCSDTGNNYADYAMTSSKVIIKKKFVTNVSKDDLRLAGW
jgi:hypothetical protein